MADTMYPMDFPPIPPEFIDAIGETGPGPIVDAMGGGMEAFATAMQGGGDMESAGQAFMDHMSATCGNGDVPGVTPETFETFADTFADVAGPAMMGMPADAGAGDMAACFQQAADIMMPPEMDMPPEMGDMFAGMADTFVDCGCGAHDVGAEFGPPMPDGFVPGDPSTFPEGDYGPPPVGDMAGGAQDMGSDAAVALSDALGAGPMDGPAVVGADPAAAADVSIGAAIDSQMEQGGAPTAPTAEDDPGASDVATATGPEDDIDPAAGIG